jgi:diguanylate cyclase (GGDEF)-like protein/PAS domain S-box-containing protein
VITQRPDRPPDESLRLAALQAYEILESAKESRFDRIVTLAAGYFGVPMAVVTLVGESRLWVKAAHGTELAALDRDVAFCAYTILGRDVCVIEDTHDDQRFRHNDLVDAGIRFYAGAPLLTPDGYAIGAMALLDTRPRTLDENQRRALADFAAIVVDELELRSSHAREHRDGGRLRSILSASPLAIYSVDMSGCVLTWNPGAETMYGWQSAEIIGKPLPIIDDRNPDHLAIRARILSGEPFRSFRACGRAHRDGSTIDLNLSSAPIRDERGAITSVVVIAEDITELMRSERRDDHRRRVLELAATGAPRSEALDEIIAMVEEHHPGSMAVISLVDGDRLQFGAAGPKTPAAFAAAVNSIRIGPGCAPCGAAAFEKATVVANDMLTDDRWESYRFLATDLGIRSVWSEPIVNRIGTIALNFTKRTPPRPEDLRELTDAANLSEIVLGRYSDRDNLERLALYDSLTSLPNRVLFANRLKHALEVAERVGRPIAVGMIDLDRFKAVNDSYGHRIGDDVLVRVAALLSGVLRPSDTLARRGGDEFLLLLPDITSPEAAQEVGDRLRDAMRAELGVGTLDIFMRASIGIAIIDPANTAAPIEQLIDRGLQEADLAMYEAKKRGDSIVVYAPTMGAPKNRALESMLVRAQSLGELVLHYQPQVDSRTGTITGCEALLRWNNPRMGTLYPGEFLNLAEETGLIVPIGAAAIEEACFEAARWHRGGERISVAVNLSPRQFETDDLFEVVRGALERSGLEPAFLELEISEKLVVGANGRASNLLRLINGLGVRLSIDDFGTGYSNLASLHEFNVDALKIDKSFVDRIGGDDVDRERAKEIVRTIVSLARALGMSTVAEGVETLEQRDTLQSVDCPIMQGYLWSPALSAAGFGVWRQSFTARQIA